MLKAPAQAGHRASPVTKAAAAGTVLWAVGVALVGGFTGDEARLIPAGLMLAAVFAVGALGAVTNRPALALTVLICLMGGLALLAFGFYLHLLYAPSLVLLFVSLVASLAHGSVLAGVGRTVVAWIVFWLASSPVAFLVKGVPGFLAAIVLGGVVASITLRGMGAR